MKWSYCLGLIAAMALLVSASHAEPNGDAKRAAQKAELARVQFLAGSWKGVAQPQRGSSKGAWTEQVEWAWRFEEGKVELAAELDDSKLFESLSMQANGQPGHFILTAAPAASGEPIHYTGSLDDAGKLILTTASPPDGLPARMTLRTVAGGKRLLVLYEKHTDSRKRFTRLAEVGYTRQGSGFGKGGSGPECVVTGGYGSIEVIHNGKTYYVCCTGCRDYFLEKPDEVLAEYAARKAAEKRAAADKK